MVTSYSNLGNVKLDIGRFKEAEILFLEAINIYKIEYNENHPNLATYYSNLANVYKI